MGPSELLAFVVRALERLGLRYLVTGSVATIYYGEPRFTNDIDVVVVLPPARVAEFCRAFPAPEFYVDDQGARKAAERGGEFNIIHPASGLQVDVIIAQDTRFDRSRLARAVRVERGAGCEAFFASAEDVVIKKMEYYRAGGSEKHLRDITGVLRVSGDRIDRAYIEDWASRLGLQGIWKAVMERAAHP